jgi:crossover junction endodeoxyribonuclease RusA
MQLSIFVVGRPAPQGSKQRGAAGQLLEQSTYLPAWRAACRIGAYRAFAAAGIGTSSLPVFPADTPVYISRCEFSVSSLQCRADGSDEPIGTPDIDKLLRSTLDALGGARRQTARVYADDAQIVSIDGLRKIRKPGGFSGAHIIISDQEA